MTHDPIRSGEVTGASAPDDPLDPQIRQFVSAMAQAWTRYPPASTLSIVEMRRIAEEIREPWRSGGPVMASTDELIATTVQGDVRVRIYRPVATDNLQPALIYLHGGGWTLFSLDTHDRVMRELAARSGVVVVGVDYALSPEARFPTALLQVVAVARWLHERGATLGIDVSRVAIGGDSAGANLSVATCLLLRDHGMPHVLIGMLLHYGVYTNELSEQAINGYGAEGNLLTSNEMTEFWTNYLARPEDVLDPLATPLRAQLEGLPPACLLSAQCDVLAEQSVAFAQRLRTAGVAVVAKEYAGATHSFLEAVSIAAVADEALRDGGNWLRARLGAAPVGGA